MLESLAALGAWSVEAVYLPLAAWTIVAATVLVLDALLPLRRPLVRRNVLIVLLVALPAGVAGRALVAARVPEAALVSVTMPGAFEVPEEPAAPTVEGDAGTVREASAGLRWGALVAGVGLLAMGGGALVALGLFGVRVRRLRRLSAVCAEAGPMPLQQFADALATQTATPTVRLCVRPETRVPMTLGVRHPLVVIPTILTDDPEALRLALLHELAHVRHGDAAMALVVGFVRAIGAAHPLVHVAGRRVELVGELACDAAVLTAGLEDQRAYAHLLARFAGPSPALAPSLAPRPSVLRRRLTALRAGLLLARGGGIAVCAGVVMAGLVVVTGCLETDRPAPPAPPMRTTRATGFDVVPPVAPLGVTPAEAVFAPLPKIPDAALQSWREATAHIEVAVSSNGLVLGAASISSGGALRVPDRVRTPMTILDRSAPWRDAAMAAARRWRFRPATRDGRAVPVRMIVTFTFDEAGRVAARTVMPQQARSQPQPIRTRPAAPSPVTSPASPASIPSTSNPDTTMTRSQRLLASALLAAGSAGAALPATAQTTPFQPAATSPLTPLTQVGPTWPEGARRDSIEGRVVLNVYVETDGRVADVKTLRTALRHAGTGEAIPETSPYVAAFAATASDAARQWTFTPVAVAAWQVLPMHFQMPNGTIEAARAACAVPSGIGRGAENTFLHFGEPRGTAPGRAATETDSAWLTCVAGRLNPNATSQEVKDYQAAAVATLAALGGR